MASDATGDAQPATVARAAYDKLCDANVTEEEEGTREASVF